MQTSADVEVNGSQATLKIGEATLIVQALEPAGAHFEAISATAPAPQNPNKGISKLVLHLPGPVTATRIAVLMTPVLGSATPGKPVIKPLVQWK